jgi:peptidyl-prolyl cis-trans isomerase B (cyclophilin B)
MKKICLWIGIAVAAIAVIIVGVGIIKSKTYNPKNPIVTIEIEGYEKPIKVELDAKSAPNAVANFVKLANSGFYNDYKMTIDEKEIVSNSENEKARLSKIVENPKKDYIYGIKGDLIANGVDNFLKHKKGVITMHRNDYSYFGYTEEGYNSANSTFGILTEDNDNYNGRHIPFGKVIEGMDVLEAIAATRVEETESDASEETTEEATTETAEAEEEKEEKNVIVIKSITVDTFGTKYEAPEYSNYEENIAKVNEICQQYFGSDYESIFK